MRYGSFDKREGHRHGTVDYMIAVNFFIVLTGLAGCNHQHLMATPSQAFCKIAAKGGDTINGRPMEVGCNKYFHTC